MVASPPLSAFLEELLGRTKLSALIGQAVKLEAVGKEFKACCPFHEEKTPSFVVNDEKAFFHCFGCGAHGDAITWLRRKRGIPFTEAVKELAEAAGLEVPLPNRKGGAKLNRSETVTVRLDPKLNYLCELAARAQRRTKSSFIEWAIADSLRSVALPEVVVWEDIDETRQAFLHDKASELWHVDEPDRVAALALIAPALLTHEEQLIWRLVRENGYLWRGRFDARGEWIWSVENTHLIRERLREHWETFKAVAAGERLPEDLPTWDKFLVSDVPF